MYRHRYIILIYMCLNIIVCVYIYITIVHTHSHLKICLFVSPPRGLKLLRNSLFLPLQVALFTEKGQWRQKSFSWSFHPTPEGTRMAKVDTDFTPKILYNWRE